jgi:glycosyltransferase involved in cell wall biosynthesis
MIAIVMAYFDRPYQLKKTLQSIKTDVHVIIIDDNSTLKPEIPEVSFPVEVITVTKKQWVNPCAAYNIGFKRAVELNAEIIIVQNPECYHVGNIVEEAANVKDDEYISFGCFSIDENTTFTEHKINDVINSVGASHDGQNAWYNHSKYRPVNFHFCAAIKTKNIIAINGFDERFAYGIGYDDNMILQQMRNLGLKIRTIDEPFVVHQWHYTSTHPDKAVLVEKNRRLWDILSKTKEYKAVHLITPNLCL